MAAGKSVGLVLLAAYVFYDSFGAALILIPAGIFYMRDCIEDLSEKKEREFLGQFKDSIQGGGRRAEGRIFGRKRHPGSRARHRTAVWAGQKDPQGIQPDDPTAGHEYVNRCSLDEFAGRTGQEDVENFVNVFAAAKKSGGDSIAIIRNAVQLISDRIDTEKEIRTMIASQKLEFDIMCVVPFAIILYMKATFGEFLGALYGNAAGVCVMTVCLLLYVAAYRTGRKIIRIEV